jgi:hypothetical protein
MAIEGRKQDEVAGMLSRVIAQQTKRTVAKEDEEEQEERATDDLINQPLKAQKEAILEGCNAYDFVKADLGLLVSR